MIDLGDTHTSSIEVYTAPPDQGGTLLNPSSVTLTITAPDGTVTTPSATNTAVGMYKYDLVATQAGLHSLRWATTGPATAYTDLVDVRPAVPAYLMSLADAKRQVNIPASITTDDEELRTYIEGTTSVIETHLNKIVVRRSVSELLTAYGRSVLALRHVPVISLTSLARVDGTLTYDVAQLQVDGTTGIVCGLTTPTTFTGFLRAVYTAGYLVVPANITLAAKIILQDNWNTQRQPGIGSPGLFGAPEIVLSPSGMGFAIPARAVALLGARAPVIA